MSGYKRLAIILFLSSLITSCKSPQALVSIEVLHPANITYPENVEKIGFLNRAPLTMHSFDGIVKKNLSDTDLQIIDTIICNNLIKGFIEGKSNSDLDYLEDFYYLEARRKDTLSRGSAINSEKISEICRSFGLDALVSQDYYEFKFDAVIYPGEYNFMETYLLLIQKSRWSVYAPDSIESLDTYTYYDTLFFTRNTFDSVLIRYPTPTEMLQEGSQIMGHAFGTRNRPIWSVMDRIVYTGYEKELRQAKKYTDEGDWDKARYVWSQNLHSDSKKLAAKCAHNLAVYYEIDDEIEQALIYSKRAHELWPSLYIEQYKDELELRQLNKKDVFKQLRVE